MFSYRVVNWSQLILASTFSLINLLTRIGELKTEQPSEDVATFLKSFCINCHNGDAGENQLDLAKLDWNEPRHLELYVRMYDRVQDSEMPPPDETQPSQGERQAFLNELSKFLERRDQDRINSEGRAIKRRLNRYEYENTTVASTEFG